MTRYVLRMHSAVIFKLTLRTESSCTTSQLLRPRARRQLRVLQAPRLVARRMAVWHRRCRQRYFPFRSVVDDFGRNRPSPQLRSKGRSRRHVTPAFPGLQFATRSTPAGILSSNFCSSFSRSRRVCMGRGVEWRRVSIFHYIVYAHLSTQAGGEAGWRCYLGTNGGVVNRVTT